MKLIVQPGDGMAPLLKAIKQAKKSIEIVIFRFNQAALERALVDAVQRGVFVHALIAFTNRGGEEGLRKLEMRFLENGITVARTDDDLVRYHGKMMLVDRKELFVTTFNFTHLDMERTRSFGVSTKNAGIVTAAGKLFDCDTKRQLYKSKRSKLVVSPANARQQLVAFIKGAKRELQIYDIRITDRPMLRLLEERMRAGVRIKVIGQVNRGCHFPVRRLKRLRLHARVIIRDCQQAFLGSQSLRKLELDSRREIGIIVRGAKVIDSLIRIFEDDWKSSVQEKTETAKPAMAKRLARDIAKKVPVEPMVGKVVKILRRETDFQMDRKAVKQTVEGAVKAGLKKAVKKAAAQVVEGVANGKLA